MDEHLPPAAASTLADAVDYDQPPVADETEDILLANQAADRKMFPYALVGVGILATWRIAGVRLTSKPEDVPTWLQLTITGLLTLFVMGYPIWAIRRCGGRVYSRRPRFTEVLLEGAIAFGVEAGVMATLVVIGAIWTLLSGKPPSPPPQLENLAFSGNWLLLLLLAVLACLWAPVSEEIFFRRFLFRALADRMPVIAALVIQAVIFAVMHDYAGPQLVAITVLGLALGGLYLWRKTLLAPMLLHCMQNTFATTMMALLMVAHLMSPQLGIRGDDTDAGCRVTEVRPGSAADQAGLRVGDVITKFDGRPVPTFFQLRIWLMGKRPGQVVSLEIRRDGQSMKLRATLQARDKTGPAARPPAPAPRQVEP